MKNILYIGLDVDDKAFHGAGFCESSKENIEFSLQTQQVIHMSLPDFPTLS